jgi:hypothetical protein
MIGALLRKTITGAGKYAGQPLKTKFASRNRIVDTFSLLVCADPNISYYHNKIID